MIDSLRRAFNRLRAFPTKQTLDKELDAEMNSHLEFAIEENMQRGLTADEARRQVLIRFGGFQQAKEIHRETRGLPIVETLLQDLRYTLRTLRRDRGSAVTAILILALAIGANIAVFSVVNTILLRPLPFRDAQRLTWITRVDDMRLPSLATYTVSAFEEFESHNKSFEAVTSYQAFFNSIEYKLQGNGEPIPVFGVQVACNFFQTLDVQPAMGRLFLADECHSGGRSAAVLSYPFWKSQFGSDRNIVGHTVKLNDQEVTVIGVMPPTFDFGSVFSPGLRVDFYVPAVMDFWRTWGNTLALVGRLKPGITPAQAQAESDVLFPQLKAAHPEWFESFVSKITDLKTHVSGQLRRSLIILWWAVGLVLLIACVNLSNLLVARAGARSKEFAMRLALGAGRARIVRQLLTESLVLSCAGALLGLVLASIFTSYISRQASITLPLLSNVRVDGTALSWTLLITVSAALVFGIVPAFQISSGKLHPVIKDSGGPGMSQSARHQRLRSTLVILEVGLACVLMIGAGLLMRSFLRVLDVDLGFNPSSAAAIKIQYDDAGKPARRGAILADLLLRLSEVPGIECAGIADMLPLDRNRSWGFQAKGRSYRKGELQATVVYVISPGYFAAMGMRLQGGRDFSWRDSADSEPVVVINHAAARLHWPSVDAIGRVSLVNNRATRVVGVIDDVRESSLEDVASPQMYLPITQADPEGSELVLRTRLLPDSLRPSVMRILRSINPGQPATQFRPIQQLVNHAVSPRRFSVSLVAAFAALGLALAALGIYGVISYAVNQRTQEIGIRVALGATQAGVQLSIIKSTFRLAMFGIGLGTLASLAVGRLIASLLYDTGSSDAATFSWAIMSLFLVALLAGYIQPAGRPE